MKQNELVQAEERSPYSFRGTTPAADPDRLPALPPDGGNETVRKVERSIDFMREHINQPLQVATLAAFANVSPSHFFALFKQLTGCPPMDYFTRLRMRHACRLLDSTPASVKEVAAVMGYDDPFYFSRVFKSINKVAPTEYRNRAKTPLFADRRATWDAGDCVSQRMAFP